MVQLVISDFESGLRQVIHAIINRQEEPFLVALLGHNDSGRLTLRTRAREYLWRIGIEGIDGVAGDDLERLKKLNGVDNPKYVLLQDHVHPDLTNNQFNRAYGRFPNLRVYICAKFNLEEMSTAMRTLFENNVYGVIIENTSAHHVEGDKK